MNTISFPGLGIEPFTVNEIAFKVPFLNTRGVAWYGIIITFGMILAFVYAICNAKREELTADDIIDVAIAAIISGVIGARLYYVVFRGGYTNLHDVIAIWDGGLGIYGGIIFGGAAVVVVALIKKVKVLRLFDLLSPCLLIGQAIGRWGNFINAEAHGIETKLPWRMGIQVGTVMKYYHPTFLYESLWNLLGLILVVLLYRKKKFNGEIFFTYIAWYGLGRLFIEGLRTDSLYWGTIRISQLVAFLSVITGIVMLFILGFKAKNDRLKAEAYSEVYSSEASEPETGSTSDVSDGAAESDPQDDGTSDSPAPDIEKEE